MAYSSDKFKKALEQKVPKQQTSAIKADSPYDQSKFYSAFRRAVKNNPNVSVAAKNPYQAQNSRQSYLDYVERRVGSTTDTTAQTYGSTLSGYDPKKYAGVQTEYDRLTAQKQPITELKQKKQQLEDIFNAYGEIPFSDGNGKFHYRPEVQKVYDQIADINRQIQQAQKDWDDSGAAAALKKLETENKNYLAVAAKEYGTEGVKSRAAAYDTAKMSAAELKRRQQQLQDIILASGEAALPDSDGNMRYSEDVQKRYEELQAVQRQLQQAEQQRDLAGVDLSLAVRSERNRKYYDLPSETWFNKAAYMGQKMEVPEYEKAASGVENKLGFYEQYKDDAPVETFTDNIGNTHTVKNAGAQLIDEGNRKHWDLLNEDERNVYFALLNHDGSKAADQFLEDIQVSLDQRAYDQRSEETQQEVHEAGTGKKIGMNALSIGANVLGQVPAAISDAVSMTDSAITDGEFNPYTNAHAWQQYAQDVRTATGEDIYNSIADSEGYQTATAELEELKQLREEELARTGGTESSYDARIKAAEKQLSGMKAQNAWGEIVSNGYQAVMSGLDSAVGATLMGKYYTLSMGAGAASQRARELYEAGASRDQIAGGAVASGVVEALFEYVSLDKFAESFLKSPVTGKMDFVKKLLVQGGIEATEEMNTELANMIVDAWNRGWTSDNNNAIREYMEKDGLSYAEAERKAAADAAMNVFWAAYGGFVSGGAMGAVGGIENKIRYNQYLQKTGENIVGSGNLSDLLENAGTVQDDSGKVAQLRQSLEGTDTTTQSSRELKKTNRQVGELYDRVQQSNMGAAIRTETQLVQELAAEELAKQGVENPQAAAEAVAKSYAGKPMSTNEKTLFDRVNGQQILDTVTSGESFSSEVERRLEPIAQQYRRNYESTVYSKAEAQEARAAVGELEENRNYDPDAMRQVYRAGQNPELFSSAYRAAYDFGRFGGTQEQAFAAKSTHYLTQEQRQAAYAAGTEARKEVARSFYRSAGRQNKGVDNIPMQLARALTLEERQQAYAAGMAEADTKEGTNYGTENRVRQSTQRADSANPGGEARGVAESTAVGQVRSQEGGSRSAENSGKVSAAELGIPGGSTSQNVSILTPERYGDSERAAEQAAKDRGLKLVVFSGDALEITEAGEDGTTHSFRARGTIVGDTIYARADDPDFTTAQIARHEAAHRDIAEGKLDMEAARQRIRELFDDSELSYLAQIYADAYGDSLTDEQVWEEIVCDSVAEMNVFADEKSLSDYVDVLLGEAAEGAKNPGQKSGESGGTKFSREIARDSAQADITKQYQKTVHDILAGNITVQGSVLMGYTPQLFRKLGMPSLPFTIGAGHIYSIAKTKQEAIAEHKPTKGINFHGMGEQAVANLYKAIQDPVMIIASKDVSKTDTPMRSTHSVVAIIDVGQSDNHLLMPVAIATERKMNSLHFDVNALTSSYMRSVENLAVEAIARFNIGDKTVFYVNKNAAALIGAGVQFPKQLQQAAASNGIVHQFSEKVNMEISDVTQSRQFKRWFGDWQNKPSAASKIVNDDGTPKVVYHQTAANITAFDNSHPVAGANDSETPNGFFFKENDHDIGLPGKRQMAVYLNMRKPLHFANREEANMWYQKNIPGYAQLQQEMQDKLDPVSKQMDAIEDQMFADDVSDERYDQLDQQWNDLLEEMKTMEDSMRGRLRGLLNDYFLNGQSGYDGIILDYDGHRYVNGKREDVKSYIVFDRTQIKSATDIVGTFDRNNPDIRYSRELNRDVSRLQAENRELRRKLENARKQTKLSSPVVSARDEDVNRYTRRLLKEYGSNVGFQEAAKLVKQIAETVLRNPDGYTNQAAYGSILRNAEKLAEQIVGGFNTVFTEQDRQDAVQFTRNDILDDIFSGEIRKEPSTYADRQNAKYQKLQRNLESIHRDYAERDRRMADRRSRTEKIQSIRKLGDQFKRMISAPAKGATQHAPVTLLSAAAVLCNVLTEEQNARLNRSEQYLERRAEALANADIRGAEDLKAARLERADIERREQRITKTREALAKLSKIYANLQGGVDGKFFDPHVAELLKTVSDTLEGKTLYDLNAGELDDVSCAMRALHYTIKNANQVFAMGQQKTLNEVSQRWYRQIQNTTAAKNQAAVAARRYFMWQLSPENFFSYTCGWAKNNEGIAVSNMFKNGTERYLRVQKEFYELFRPFTESTDKDVQKAMKRLLQNQTKELVTIPGLTTENGKDIKVSRSMAMMLHMLISQQHSRQAIVMGGLKIPKLDVYYKGKIVDSYGDADLGDLLSNSVGRGYVEIVRDIQELQKELDGLRELEMLEGMERQISEVRVTSQQNPNPELLEQNQERSYGDRAVEIENQIRALEHQAKTIAESGEIKLLEIQRELEDMFTDTEKDLIRTAAEWFRHTGDLMREVYQDMYGYSPLLVENYVPVHRDTTTVVIDIRTENGQVFNLENSPFTIHRVKSSSPILLTDLFSELASQMERSARYYGFAQAQRDFNRIWNNYVGTGQTVNGAIESRFGSGTTTLGVSGTMYVENFLKSVAGTNKSNDILSKFYGNAAAATLTLNGRVAMSQLASIPTAAGVVGWKNMAKGFVKGLPTAFSTEKKRQLANDSLWFYSRYKGAGGITEVADLRQKGGFWKRIADSPVGKHLFNWCQAMDVFATSTMWSMAEEAVQQRGMKPNTEGYSDAVAAQYAEIIRKTQPNYTETERSDLLRDKRGGVKFLTMYKTQSNQNLNLLLSSAGELTKAMRDYKAGINGVTAMDVKNAKVNMVNAATSVIIGGSLAFVLLRTAMNFLLRKVNPYRDKETDEVTMEGVLKGAKKEFASSMFGMVALGGDVFDFVYSAISKDTYYGISDSAIGLISDAGNTGQKLLSTLHSAIEEGNYEKVPEELKKFLMDFCKVFGVPASNAESLYNAAMEWLHELQSGTLGQYLPEDPSCNQLNAQILRAYETGDSEKIGNVLAMMAAKTEADTDQEAQKEVLSEVKSYLKKRYLDGGVNIDTARGILGEYLDVSREDLDDLTYAWNFTAKNPEYAGTGKLSDTAIMKYKDLEKANITVAQWYEIYKTCSGFESDKDKDGKTISGTKKKKIVNYIHSLNLSNAQKNAVWKAVAASNNYSDKTLPPKM